MYNYLEKFPAETEASKKIIPVPTGTYIVKNFNQTPEDKILTTPIFDCIGVIISDKVSNVVALCHFHALNSLWPNSIQKSLLQVEKEFTECGGKIKDTSIKIIGGRNDSIKFRQNLEKSCEDVFKKDLIKENINDDWNGIGCVITKDGVSIIRAPLINSHHTDAKEKFSWYKDVANLLLRFNINMLDNNLDLTHVKPELIEEIGKKLTSDPDDRTILISSQELIKVASKIYNHKPSKSPANANANLPLIANNNVAVIQ